MNATLLELGLPDIWSGVITCALLAATVSLVLRTKSVWVPLVIFLGGLAAYLVWRFGGFRAFVAWEIALVLIATMMWMRRKPKVG